MIKDSCGNFPTKTTHLDNGDYKHQDNKLTDMFPCELIFAHCLYVSMYIYFGLCLNFKENVKRQIALRGLLVRV